MEPSLNAREVVLLDAPLVEQQLLGLVWHGGKIDHPGGEHDDWANAVAGVVALMAQPAVSAGTPTLVLLFVGQPELDGGASGLEGFSLITGADSVWRDGFYCTVTRNHHGSRSRRGTQVAALFYNLIESAKLTGVD